MKILEIKNVTAMGRLDAGSVRSVSLTDQTQTYAAVHAVNERRISGEEV